MYNSITCFLHEWHTQNGFSIKCLKFWQLTLSIHYLIHLGIVKLQNKERIQSKFTFVLENLSNVESLSSYYFKNKYNLKKIKIGSVTLVHNISGF